MGVLQAIADVILILAALLSIIAFASLAYVGFLIYRLVKSVRTEVTQVTDSAKETLSETRATVRFVSDGIVRPASVVAGYVASIRQTLKALSEDVIRRSRP